MMIGGGGGGGGGRGGLQKHFSALWTSGGSKNQGGGECGLLPRILYCCPNDIFVLEIDHVLYSNVAGGKRGKLT